MKKKQERKKSMVLKKQQKLENWQHGQSRKTTSSKYKEQPEKVVPKLLPVKPERETGEKPKQGLGWVRESTERKRERCYFLHCYRAHQTCNLQLKPPCLLWAALQAGVTRDRENQARNRVISEKSCWSYSTQTLVPCGQTRLQEEEQTKGNQTYFLSAGLAEPTKTQENSLSQLLLRSGKPMHVACPALGRAKCRGVVHSSCGTASSHLFQVLLCPVKCSACCNGLITGKSMGHNSHLSLIFGWRQIASPILRPLGPGSLGRR